MLAGWDFVDTAFRIRRNKVVIWNDKKITLKSIDPSSKTSFYTFVFNQKLYKVKHKDIVMNKVMEMLLVTAVIVKHIIMLQILNTILLKHAQQLNEHYPNNAIDAITLNKNKTTNLNQIPLNFIKAILLPLSIHKTHPTKRSPVQHYY